MTTITPSIVPTGRLSRWRKEHPERYPFVLSDFKPLQERISGERSCLRNRKPWLIDNSFYVSSRAEGTVPLATPNPKEFHEQQWRRHESGVGKFVHEREISDSVSEQCGEFIASTAPHSQKDIEKTSRASRSSLLKKIVNRISSHQKESEEEQRRRS
jgi:hypothetical protein